MHKTPESLKTKFTLQEFSGSLGDLGLFIPLVVAAAIAANLNLVIVLIAAGLMNILTGVLFKQPIPVQPMKAIAAVAITGSLTQGDIIASGLCMAFMLFALSITGALATAKRYVPNALVRGIQLGVGIKLVEKGILWISNLPAWGLNSICAAIIIAAMLLICVKRKIPGLLPIFLAGFAMVFIENPDVSLKFSVILPTLELRFPTPTEWSKGLLYGALPQLPLTLLNSVIAVCALSADYFPKHGIKPYKMATSVGLMNLICVPFGALPMCHGAGGLAAQYRFGARTGGSVIMLGVVKIILGIGVGGMLTTLLGAYPNAILAPMLLFAGIELAKSVLSLNNKTEYVIAILTALGIFVGNTLTGFLLGAALLGVLAILQKYQKC